LHRANIRAMKGTANAFFAHPPRHRKQGVVSLVHKLIHCD
jgi:hypothetical protein